MNLCFKVNIATAPNNCIKDVDFMQAIEITLNRQQPQFRFEICPEIGLLSF
jgi:hypothetical protein